MMMKKDMSRYILCHHHTEVQRSIGTKRTVDNASHCNTFGIVLGPPLLPFPAERQEQRCATHD